MSNEVVVKNFGQIVTKQIDTCFYGMIKIKNWSYNGREDEKDKRKKFRRYFI